jgi:hypothetical protein
MENDYCISGCSSGWGFKEERKTTFALKHQVASSDKEETAVECSQSNNCQSKIVTTSSCWHSRRICCLDKTLAVGANEYDTAEKKLGHRCCHREASA